MDRMSVWRDAEQERHTAVHHPTSAIYLADRALGQGDKAKAYELYTIAAQRDHHPRALRMLGQFHEHGFQDDQNAFSVPVNYDLAIVYYTEAYHLGDELARAAVREMLERMSCREYHAAS